LEQDRTSESKPDKAALESRLLSRTFPVELDVPKGSQLTRPD